jgi:hypothetical protein
MQQFRQWNQMNVDYGAQKMLILVLVIILPGTLTAQVSTIIYYETQIILVTLLLDNKINDWLSAMVRFSFDTYSELQEERINVGSADVSSYSRRNSNVSEYNYDAMLNFNKDLTEKLNLEGNIGFNLRNNTRNNIFAATNGGLSLRSLYSFE